MKNSARNIHLTLVCRSLPSVDEPVIVGIQDKEQNVRKGKQKKDGSFEFECTISIREKNPNFFDFSGSFVHGTPAARFLYLSWKRTEPSLAPWLQRVKVPLALLALVDLAEGAKVSADITDRRPHATEPVKWEIIGEKLGVSK